MNAEPQLVPHPGCHDPGIPSPEAARRYYETLCSRRTVRSFSDRPVPRETIEWIVRSAGSAPSGANLQPWRFVAISDSTLKRTIREAAEAEEQAFYRDRATPEWLRDLAPLGTDCEKPYLEIAPWLVVVFRLTRRDDGGNVYYARESVGIALGFLLAAAHQAGLATLVHTPSPMGFLREVLGRPEHEQALALVPIGYPSEDCQVPAEAMRKKSLEEILVVEDARGNRPDDPAGSSSYQPVP